MDTKVAKLVLVQELEGHADRAWSLAWNPRMPLLASCSSDKTVNLHSYALPNTSNASTTPTFSLREQIPTGHKRTVRSVAWAPNGKTLATASFDSTVGIWERVADVMASANGEQMDLDDDQEGQEAQGALPLGERPEEGSEWDCIGTLEGHDNECKDVAFSHTGSVLASCSRDKSVWIWEVQPDAEFECLSVLMEHTQDVKAVAFHPKEEMLASASYDDTIRLYLDDPSDDWFCISTLSGHSSTVWSLAFSPCGNYLASASADCTIRLWRRLNAAEAESRALRVEGKMPGREGEKWVCAEVLKGWHERTVYSVSWAKGNPGSLGRIASGGGDGRICVFEVLPPASDKDLAPRTTLLARIERAHDDADVNCVKWAPSTLARKASGIAARFEEVDDEGVPKRNPTEAGLSDLLASAGDDGSVRVWTVPGSKWAAASVST